MQLWCPTASTTNTVLTCRARCHLLYAGNDAALAGRSLEAMKQLASLPCSRKSTSKSVTMLCCRADPLLPTPSPAFSRRQWRSTSRPESRGSASSRHL
jgi:hypothetical protein